MSPPSALQLEFVADLCKQIRLSAATLDRHCCDTFGRPFGSLDMRQVSTLIDELKTWKAVPAHLQRAMGQRDLFEVNS